MGFASGCPPSGVSAPSSGGVPRAVSASSLPLRGKATIGTGKTPGVRDSKRPDRPPTPSDLSSHRLLRAFRIRRRAEFLALQSGGEKLYTRDFVVIVRRSELAASRIGIVVTVKLDKRAAVRNRIRRRVRELFRTHRPQLTDRFDIVVVARKNAASLEYTEMRRQILGVLEQRGYLRTTSA